MIRTLAGLAIASLVAGCTHAAIDPADEQIDIVCRDIAIQAARNFRALRAKRVTVRKTIDTLIATRCIEDGLALLFSDRDFTPCVEHLGLVSAL